MPAMKREIGQWRGGFLDNAAARNFFGGIGFDAGFIGIFKGVSKISTSRAKNAREMGHPLSP
jgi:hypothetical protein